MKRDEAGRTIGIVGSWTDITARKELEARLKEVQQRLLHMATHDPLTDLPNRRLFLDRLELAMARARRYGCGVAVVFLDVDDLKPVNDRYGHPAGDQLLRELARRLRSSVRKSDTVARIGGRSSGSSSATPPGEGT